MFTPQTEAALAANIGAEAGQPWAVTLTAEAYRELVFAARQWDAFRSGPVNCGANVELVPQPDGSLRIEAQRRSSGGSERTTVSCEERFADRETVPDDQEWDRNAEQLTREALGADVDQPMNPHATTVDNLFETPPTTR